MSYCTRADIEAIFGKSNVERWADLENNGVSADITARITAAIAFADDDFDSQMREGPYVLPLETVDPIVVDICAKLAGVWLYESRGVEDFDAETGKVQHKLQFQRDDAARKIKEILAGKRRLSLVDTDQKYEAIPAVVKDE